MVIHTFMDLFLSSWFTFIGMCYIFIEGLVLIFHSCVHFISHFSSLLIREVELYSLSDSLKVHVSRDYNESFHGFPKVVIRIVLLESLLFVFMLLGM